VSIARAGSLGWIDEPVDALVREEARSGPMVTAAIGFDNYLVKPFDLDVLLAAIEELIGTA